MRWYDIGETFEENGVEVMCVPATLDCSTLSITCKGCAFAFRPYVWCKEIACHRVERDDRTPAHFKAVKSMDDITIELVKTYAKELYNQKNKKQ